MKIEIISVQQTKEHLKFESTMKQKINLTKQQQADPQKPKPQTSTQVFLLECACIQKIYQLFPYFKSNP